MKVQPAQLPVSVYIEASIIEHFVAIEYYYSRSVDVI